MTGAIVTSVISSAGTVIAAVLAAWVGRRLPQHRDDLEHDRTSHRYRVKETCRRVADDRPDGL